MRTRSTHRAGRTRLPARVPLTLTVLVVLAASLAPRWTGRSEAAEPNDSQKVNQVAAALTVPNVGDARGNLTLATDGAYGTTVSWRSDRPQVISTDGVVRRPPAGAEAVRVNLIATVSLNQANSSRTFQGLVPPLPAAQPLAGYLFSYFTGQNTADDEQIHLALSRGNDPLKFRELNGGRPVLTSTVGDRAVRDPFIIRSPQGDRFYQIATDLRIFGRGDWNAAQRTGSRSIVVWESTDLLSWSEPRLVEVSPGTAGNTWAPEAVYDPGLGAYVVFWASKIYADSDARHTGNTHNRLMYATTRDFHTFTPAKPYLDPGYAVIDTTMIEHDGTWYRYTKDERGGESPTSKQVFQEAGDGVLGGFRRIGETVPRNAAGSRLFAAEGPTIVKSNTEDRWYLFLDDFGGRGYRPFESTDLASGRWTEAVGAELPRSPRHGTILPITRAEYDRIAARYGVGASAGQEPDHPDRSPVGEELATPPR